MPPRWLSVPIVVFWLATTGWLFYHDVWPLLLPGQAPPFTIDLEDEVQTQQAHIHWSVSYNDRPYLQAETWVEPNPADETFALKAQVRPLAAGPKDPAGDAAPFGGVVQLASPPASTASPATATCVRCPSSSRSRPTPAASSCPATAPSTAKSRDGQFHSHLRRRLPCCPDLTIEKELDPVPVSTHGSVLSPLHPVNRIAGLRPGQTWRLPLVDPIKDALTALATGQPGEEIVVTARVLPQTQTLTWSNQPVECLVVEYQGDDVRRPDLGPGRDRPRASPGVRTRRRTAGHATRMNVCSRRPPLPRGERGFRSRL